MTKIGMIGLGIMGAPMARNLLHAGHQVVGFNRSDPAMRRLEQDGGIAAPNIARTVADADVVITMLPDTKDVEDVTLGSSGILDSARPGTLLIDCSTIAPDAWQSISRVASQRGIGALDAPVSGGQIGAEEATLSIMVGGAEADFRAAEPVLGAIGRTITHVGPSGAGQVVKAANQLVVAANLAIVSEAVILLEKSGLDPTVALRALAGGLAGSRVLETKSANFTNRTFEPGFRIDLHHKDLGIALSAARVVGAAVPLTGLVSQLFVAARSNGWGSADHSAVLKVIEDLSRDAQQD